MAALLPACATEDAAPTPSDDELASGNDGDAAKADAAHDTFGFDVVARTGLSDCPSPQACPAYMLTRANRSTIKCVDGVYNPSCYVQRVAWDSAGLSQTQITKIENALKAETNDPTLGVQVLAKGTYTSAGDGVTFEPSEVWVAQLSNPRMGGTFVQIFDRGIECPSGPCPTYEEDKLNSTLGAAIEGFAFTSNVSSSLHNRVISAAKTSGVIVVGGRGTRMTATGTALYRYTNQIFLPAK